MLLIAILSLIINSVLAAECDLKQLKVDLETKELLGMWYQQYIPVLPKLSLYKCWSYNVEETEEGFVITTKVLKLDSSGEIEVKGDGIIVDGNTLQIAYPNGTFNYPIVAANPEHFLILGTCEIEKNNPMYFISTRNKELIEADANPLKEAVKDLGLDLSTFANACDE